MTTTQFKAEFKPDEVVLVWVLLDKSKTDDIYTTYKELIEAGFKARLTKEPPDTGIPLPGIGWVVMR